jgi:hypothetical protein
MLSRWAATLVDVASHAGPRRGQWLLVFAMAAGLIGVDLMLLCTSHTRPAAISASAVPADSTGARAAILAPTPAPSAPADTSSVRPRTSPGHCRGTVPHLSPAVLVEPTFSFSGPLPAALPASAAHEPDVAATPATRPARGPPTASVRRAELCLWRH